MVDAKITQLTELTAPVAGDVLAIVDDPTGSPVTKKIKIENLQKKVVNATAKTSNYTLLASDCLILFDASSGPLSAFLPAVSGTEGKTYTLIKIDSSTNTVTIDPDGAETISDLPNFPLIVQWQAVELTSIGTQWMVTGQG